MTMKKILLNKLFISSALLLTSSQYANAETYAKGNGALEIFDYQGLLNSPTWVIVWVFLMLLAFVAGLFFVRRERIARWVVGGFISGMIALQIIELMGVTVLSGTIALVHLLAWSPGLYLLLTQRPFLNAKLLSENKGAYKTWTGIITAVILFSFIFDIRDTIIYLQHVL